MVDPVGGANELTFVTLRLLFGRRTAPKATVRPRRAVSAEVMKRTQAPIHSPQMGLYSVAVLYHFFIRDVNDATFSIAFCQIYCMVIDY